MPVRGSRLRAALGDYDGAHALLENLPDVSLRDRIEVLLLRARGEGDVEMAGYVRQALSLGEEDGYVRVFVDESEWIMPTVRRLVGSWPSGYAAEIAAAIVAEPDRRASSRNLAELSDREQEGGRFCRRRCRCRDRRRSTCR